MKTKIFIFAAFFFPFVYCLLSTANSFSQTPGEWTWMHGDNTPNSPGAFGVQGVANTTNTPPAMYEACEWKDNNGNFWLFGGMGRVGVMQEYNALWKYDPDPSSPGYNQWTWVKGSFTPNQSGIYGTQGVPSPSNYPGSRGWGAATWVDAAGNLWLFGGVGYDATGARNYLNDLWKYDIITNEWTWVKGANVVNDPGSYGTKGVASTANLPPSRYEASSSLTDGAGNFWLYGGYALGGGHYGDLWKYTISSNEWTWMHGANTSNAPALYGIQGVAAPANTPGGRMMHCSWINSGNLWLFGGGDAGAGGLKNDLWKYDISANQWTWVKGTNIINDLGNYGAKCVPANNNVPPARTENRARVQDTCGNLWNFGGFTNSMGNNRLNDLWHYNVSTNQWTWVSGDNISNQAAVYGTKGASGPANKPGAKGGSVSWIDNNGYIWIFGGMSNGPPTFYNDLFRYVPDPACVPMSAVVTVSSNTTICMGQSATLTASGGTSYSWSPGGQSTSSVVVSPTTSTTYTVTGAGSCGSDSASVSVTVVSAITATAGPNSTICAGQNTTLIASGGNNYAWSSGETTASITITPSATTTYSVIVSNGNCSDTAYATVTVISGFIVSAGSNVTVCTGTNVTLSATWLPAGTGGGSTYSWSSGQLTSSITVIATATATYTVIGTDANGCTASNVVTVFATPNIIANAGPDGTICLGDSMQLNASGGSGYSWNPSSGLSSSNSPNPWASPTVTTSYTVVISSGICTPASDVVTVVVNSNPTALAWSDVTITAGSSTILSASGGGTYSWSSGATTSLITVSPAITTQYCVTVTEVNGCTNTACVTVTIEYPCSMAGAEALYLPNAFSPNQDGENDMFCLPGGIEHCIKDLRIIIYDRWGEKIYESEDTNFCWDAVPAGRQGMYQGKPQSTAVFVYYLEATHINGDTITKKGNVSIVR